MNTRIVVICSQLADKAYLSDPLKYHLETIDTNLVFKKRVFDPKTTTDGFIAVNDITKEVFISFKGTNGTEDFLIDGRVVQVPLNKDMPTVLVHYGFREAYMSVESQLDAFGFALYKDYTFYITGHSLGGALATLACVNLKLPSKPNLYTFGSPRVGNFKFVVYARLCIGDSVRVVHSDDLIPMIPKLIAVDYSHLPTELHINSKGNEEYSSSNFFKRFWYWIIGKTNYNIFSIRSHFMDEYIPAVNNWAAKQKV